MNILLNGKAREIPEGSSLSDLLIAESLHQRRLAIEVNLEIIPRAQHAGYFLKPGDRVEIVQAIGGG